MVGAPGPVDATKIVSRDVLTAGNRTSAACFAGDRHWQLPTQTRSLPVAKLNVWFRQKP